MKYCSKGDHFLALSEFNKRSDAPHILRSHCKKCCSKENCDRAKIGRNRRKPAPTPEIKREQLRLAVDEANIRKSNKI